MGDDVYTTAESERLLRLPLYCNISVTDVNYVIDMVLDFFQSKIKLVVVLNSIFRMEREKSKYSVS